MENKFFENGESQQPPPNIQGTWLGTGNQQGYRYIIYQAGSSVMIEVIHPPFGLITVMRGIISGDTLNADYTIIGTAVTGHVQLTIAANRRQLVGSFQETDGRSRVVTLYR